MTEKKPWNGWNILVNKFFEIFLCLFLILDTGYCSVGIIRLMSGIITSWSKQIGKIWWKSTSTESSARQNLRLFSFIFRLSFPFLVATVVDNIWDDELGRISLGWRRVVDLGNSVHRKAFPRSMIENYRSGRFSMKFNSIFYTIIVPFWSFRFSTIWTYFSLNSLIRFYSISSLNALQKEAINELSSGVRL